MKRKPVIDQIELFKRVHEIECDNCGTKYSNGNLRCPRCHIENPDHWYFAGSVNHRRNLKTLDKFSVGN